MHNSFVLFSGYLDTRALDICHLKDSNLHEDKYVFVLPNSVPAQAKLDLPPPAPQTLPTPELDQFLNSS